MSDAPRTPPGSVASQDRDGDEARRQRARARASWPGRKRRLAELEEVEIVPGTPEERIAMVRELTLAAWAMTGEPIPDYDRAQAPGRLVRRGESG